MEKNSYAREPPQIDRRTTHKKHHAFLTERE